MPDILDQAQAYADMLYNGKICMWCGDPMREHQKIKVKEGVWACCEEHKANYNRLDNKRKMYEREAQKMGMMR